ncbi:MAG: hypothetical protein WC615_01215 [Mucilaginibacter sp.]|jgi:(p)ppGpp synthase/HD superfamily hydrolase|uniref:hypothetical protein n=1 Tax=Mucilaginibacter sp. TaxID=1882438 RepID=UPI00356309A4
MAWVKEQHAGQLIRKTDEPYFDHLLFVAKKVGSVFPLGYEIGICHDLLEETNITEAELLSSLLCFGYPAPSAEHIRICVVELTDVFTKAAYPELRKQERKRREMTRLADINPDAQTVKYADLIYNIDWMLRFGGGKLPNYLKRKQTLLEQLSDGDEGLRREAQALILKSQHA